LGGTRETRTGPEWRVAAAEEGEEVMEGNLEEKGKKKKEEGLKNGIYTPKRRTNLRKTINGGKADSRGDPE